MSDALIRINLAELILALQNHEPDEEFYLDLQSGAVEPFAGGKFRGEEDVDIDDVLDAEPDRYLFIEGVSSSRGYKVMEQFIEDRAPLSAKQVLWRAIEGPKPFKLFKAALADLEDVRDQYSGFEKEVYARFAKDWLKGEGIEAELVDIYAQP